MSGPWSSLREKFRTGERCTEASCHDRRPDQNGDDDDEVEPPDRGEIGRAAWRYLHAMAANHPEKASSAQQGETQSWIASFIQTYPCKHCAEHFVGVCEDMPPRTKTRQDYAVWWCEAHNAVNKHLKADLQRCEPGRLLAAGLAGKTLDEFDGVE
eukprot:TRINITY_DN60408_c0_g1_i1.p1 TRINITY_DN60408_c0_g1~~TRINITY_DN60408_c0_g1_i1.p1  ORF type:complete len:155 (-),score=24.15 TRINITY_DN60408_c0_g1_i1:65-529(-)